MIMFSVYEVMEYWCINKEKFYVFVPCKFEDEWKQQKAQHKTRDDVEATRCTQFTFIKVAK